MISIQFNKKSDMLQCRIEQKRGDFGFEFDNVMAINRGHYRATFGGREQGDTVTFSSYGESY